MNKTLYETITANLRHCGSKAYACVPTEILCVDPEYQRAETRSKEKIQNLASHWDPVQMDALKVVPHPEECVFSIVDGYGRYTAANLIGITSLECEIILSAPKDKEKRQIFEANIFLRQTKDREELKPFQMHKARVLVGDQTAVDLENLLDIHDIKLSRAQGYRDSHYLGSYTRAYNIIKVQGKDALDFIFTLLALAGFNEEPNGYGSNIMNALSKIYRAYGSKCAPLSSYLRKMSPKTFKARAVARYPERSVEIAETLFLQDYLVESCDLPVAINQKGKLL